MLNGLPLSEEEEEEEAEEGDYLSPKKKKTKATVAVKEGDGHRPAISATTRMQISAAL
ncbi:hypothetical protein Dimus_005246 [Dionaea muscipula]